MGARIVIPKAVLKRHRACDAAYTSPEYDADQDAIVYADWDETVKRLLAKGRQGIDEIDWYVANKLVPMTRDEFVALKKKFYSKGDANG